MPLLFKAQEILLLSKPEFYRSACLFWIYVFFFALPLSKTGVDYPILFAFVFYAYYRFRRPEFNFSKHPSMIVLAIFILICVLSAFTAGPYFQKSLKVFFLKWCQNFAIFFMSADLMREESTWRAAKKFFLISLAIVLFDGLLQLATGRELLLGREMTQIKLAYPALPEKIYRAVTGTFKHCNDFSAYLVFYTTLLWISFSKGGVYKNAIQFMAIFASIILIIFTYSRGAWIAFLSGFFIYMVFARLSKTHLIFWVGMVLVMFGASPVRERLAYSFQTYGDSERSELFSLTWKIIQKSPWLGNGLGTFMDEISTLSAGKVIKYAHNCFLQIWAESGLVALLAFLIFAFLLLREGFRFFRKSNDREVLALTIALSVFLIHSAFDTQLYSLQLSALFWSMSGVLFARVSKT